MSNTIPHIYIPTDIKNDPAVVNNRHNADNCVRDIKNLGSRIRQHNLNVKLLDRTMTGGLYETKEGRKYRSQTFKHHAKLKKELLERLKYKVRALKEIRAIGVELRQTLYDMHLIKWFPLKLADFMASKAYIETPFDSDKEKNHLHYCLEMLLAENGNAVVWLAVPSSSDVPLAFIAGTDAANDTFDMDVFYAHAPTWERHCEVMKYLFKRLKSNGVHPVSLVKNGPELSRISSDMLEMGGSVSFVAFNF